VSDQEQDLDGSHCYEIDDEANARLVELQFRPLRDVVRYGTMVASVQRDYNQKLEEYLNDEFNLKLYNDMNSGSWGALFDPLEFFIVFHAQYDFITNANQE
jgi:hypothetical protein